MVIEYPYIYIYDNWVSSLYIRLYVYILLIDYSSLIFLSILNILPFTNTRVN